MATEEIQVLRVDSSREIHVESSVPIVAKSVHVDKVQITLDQPEDWSGMGLEVWFTNSTDGSMAKKSWDGSAEVVIPSTVTQSSGYVGVAVVGTITEGSGDDQTITQRGVTKLAARLLRVWESIDAIGEVDPEEESMAADILDQVMSAMGRAVDARTAAEAARDTAERIAAEVGVDFTPATATTAGKHGLVPAPAAGTEGSTALTADGTWGIDLDTKADIDGYYELLTAGAADNLTGRGDGVSASFLYRTAGGSEDITDGVATVKAIYGETVGWNQLVDPTRLQFASAFGTMTKDGTHCTATLNGTNPSAAFAVANGLSAANAGHKLCAIADIKATSSADAFLVGFQYSGVASGTSVTSLTPGKWHHYGKIVTELASTTNFNIYLYIDTAQNLVAGDVVEIDHFNVFDLTAMFGAGNEPSTVEEFEALYPEPYYPYDPGTLKPVQMTGVETRGFNQWDEEWEKGIYNSDNGTKQGSDMYIRSVNAIPVFPNTVYSMTKPSVPAIHLYYYDEGMNFISHIGTVAANTPTREFTTPANCRYVNFAIAQTTYNNDIAIHLKWSGYRDGEYEQYWNSQRAIDLATYFPDGLWSVDTQTGKKRDALYETHADHAVKCIDLGTLDDWRYNTINGVYGFYTPLSDALNPDNNLRIVIKVDSPLTAVGASDLWNNTSDTNIISLNTQGMIQCRHSATSIDAFKAAMSGVKLIYPLATQTTVEIDPPLNMQFKVSDFGTEKIMVPEGEISAPPTMQIVYGLNAVDTIRRLPTQYISDDSFKNFCDAAYGSGTVTKTWDATDNCYHYEIASLDDATIAALVDADWRD